MVYKKIAAIALSGLLLSGAGGINAFAQGAGDNPNLTEDVKTKQEIKDMKLKEAAVDEHIRKKKESKGKKDDSSSYIIPDGEYKAISVPSYEQQTSYWCGPATVKQILGYINGSSSSQSYYASKLGTTKAGTDFSLVDNVLDQHQSKVDYVYVSIGDYGRWTDRIEFAVDTGGPAALDLEIYPSYMPKYTTHIAGHILNASGYDTRYSPAKVRLTDPYDQGNRGVTLGNVWHPMSGVYDANYEHFRQAMIY
jgi:hypothetical protein